MSRRRSAGGCGSGCRGCGDSGGTSTRYERNRFLLCRWCEDGGRMNGVRSRSRSMSGSGMRRWWLLDVTLLWRRMLYLLILRSMRGIGDGWVDRGVKVLCRDSGMLWLRTRLRLKRMLLLRNTRNQTIVPIHRKLQMPAHSANLFKIHKELWIPSGKERPLLGRAVQL